MSDLPGNAEALAKTSPILALAYAGDPPLPATGLRLAGDLIWFTDQAAALSC